MNVSLIIAEGNYGAIGADDTRWNGYYIIRFSLSPYTLQEEFSIDGQVISSSEMVCEGNVFQYISIIIIVFLQKTNSIT